ncbi:MAG TPA: GYD domain-containing protein [Anaerolineales bacterium]|nr:GYD domain-containing protein [Anaerolineales bacterium]
MATYFMFGKYSLEAVKAISAKRTEKTIALIKRNGGELKAGYSLLGDIDVVLIVDLPDTDQAMKTSVALSKLLGISFRTVPAVSVEDFDKLME